MIDIFQFLSLRNIITNSVDSVRYMNIIFCQARIQGGGAFGACPFPPLEPNAPR